MRTPGQGGEAMLNVDLMKCQGIVLEMVGG